MHQDPFPREPPALLWPPAGRRLLSRAAPPRPAPSCPQEELAFQHLLPLPVLFPSPDLGPHQLPGARGPQEEPGGQCLFTVPCPLIPDTIRAPGQGQEEGVGAAATAAKSPVLLSVKSCECPPQPSGWERTLNALNKQVLTVGGDGKGLSNEWKILKCFPGFL